MTSVNEEERVEVLNFDQHVGWANVVEGKWSYTQAGLTPGSYNLSGKYKGKVSSTWRVNVTEPPVSDNLDGAPSGYFKRHERPYFSVEETRGSALSPEGGAAIRFQDMGSAYPGIQGNVVYLTVASRDSVMRMLTVEVGFYKAYSAISFSCYILRKVAPGTVSTLKTFADDGSQVGTINLLDFEADTHKTVSLSGLSQGKKYKSMRFDIYTANDPSAQYRYEDVLLDNFIMTP